MAHKTFISYKYSEAVELRDKIIKALGDDAQYYKGENSYSQDLSGYKAESIKSTLRNKIWDTSVTIVIASPNMQQSKWMEWEISYSLKQIARNQITSKTNGLVIVAKKVPYWGYSWLFNVRTMHDGTTVRTINNSKLFDIIWRNRFNKKDPVYVNRAHNIFNDFESSYASIVTEEDFLTSPAWYIENAYNKSRNLDNFNIVREI